MNVEIRRAKKTDADNVRYLFRDTVLAINSKEYSKAEIDAWMDHYKNTQSWVYKIEDQHFYVAVADKNVVGFASITNAGYLDFLYIHKDFQRAGIARKLLQEIEKTAAGLKLTSITVHSSKTAKAFFENRGFVKTGEHTNKVQDISFINLVMVKTL